MPFLCAVDLGQEWSPAIICSAQELDDVLTGQTGMSNLYSAWINGTTDAANGVELVFSDIRLDGSGKYLAKVQLVYINAERL